METQSAKANRSYLRYVTLLLSVAMLFNQLDRHLLAVLAEPIRTDLGLNDTQFSLLTGIAFAVFYTGCGIPLAKLADRHHRGHLMAACLAFWSVLTALTGIAATFAQMLVFRMGVAVGESGCQPTSHSLLADYVPRERRGVAFAWLAGGISMGAMCAYLVGGTLAAVIGWRMTVVVVGLAGLPVALLFATTLREPRSESNAADPPVPIRTVLSVLAASPSYILLSATAVVAIIPITAIAMWVPAFFMRSHSLTIGEVGLWVGLPVGIGNFTGSLLGGVLTDRADRHGPEAKMRMPIFCLLAAAPALVALFLVADRGVAIALLFVPMALLAMWYPAVYSLVQQVVPAVIRTQAAAITLFLVGILATGLSPTIAGVISDSLRPTYGQESLRFTLILMSLLTFPAAGMAWLAGRSLSRDQAITGHRSGKVRQL